MEKGCCEVICGAPTTRQDYGIDGDGRVVKLPVPGRLTYLDNSRARAYCTCGGCGRRLFGHFFARLSFLSSFSLSLGDGPI